MLMAWNFKENCSWKNFELSNSLKRAFEEGLRFWIFKLSPSFFQLRVTAWSNETRSFEPSQHYKEDGHSVWWLDRPAKRLDGQIFSTQLLGKILVALVTGTFLFFFRILLLTELENKNCNRQLSLVKFDRFSWGLSWAHAQNLKVSRTAL